MGDKYDAVETGDNNIDDHTGRLVARTTTDRVPKIPVGRSVGGRTTYFYVALQNNGDERKGRQSNDCEEE